MRIWKKEGEIALLFYIRMIDHIRLLGLLESIRGVVLTDSPRYKTPYYKNGYMRIKTNSNLKNADILFTDDLNSTTVKMKRAKSLGIEIREYI